MHESTTQKANAEQLFFLRAYSHRASIDREGVAASIETFMCIIRGPSRAFGGIGWQPDKAGGFAWVPHMAG